MLRLLRNIFLTGVIIMKKALTSLLLLSFTACGFAAINPSKDLPCFTDKFTVHLNQVNTQMNYLGNSGGIYATNFGCNSTTNTCTFQTQDGCSGVSGYVRLQFGSAQSSNCIIRIQDGAWMPAPVLSSTNCNGASVTQTQMGDPYSNIWIAKNQ